jgi:hypothetical protein
MLLQGKHNVHELDPVAAIKQSSRHSEPLPGLPNILNGLGLVFVALKTFVRFFIAISMRPRYGAAIGKELTRPYETDRSSDD